jgi:hypothetical protein
MIKSNFVKQSNVKAQFTDTKTSTEDAIATFLAAGGVIDQIKQQSGPKIVTAK